MLRWSKVVPLILILSLFAAALSLVSAADIARVNALALRTLLEIDDLSLADEILQWECGRPMTAFAGPASDPAQRILVLSGIELGREGACEGAVSMWSAAQQLEPSDVVVGFHLGVLYLKLSRIEDSERQFARIGGSPPIVRELITALTVGLGSEEEIAQVLELAFWTAPSRVSVRRLEEALQNLDTPSQEVDYYYETLITIASEATVDHWWAKGRLADRRQELERAMDFYWNAVQLSSDGEEVRLLLRAMAASASKLGLADCSAMLGRIAEQEFAPDLTGFSRGLCLR